MRVAPPRSTSSTSTFAPHAFLVGERYSIADIAVYAYVHVAGEAGFDLDEYPAVRDWIERVEALPAS